MLMLDLIVGALCFSGLISACVLLASMPRDVLTLRAADEGFEALRVSPDAWWDQQPPPLAGGDRRTEADR